MVTQQSDQQWVLLSYRIPREPSTPRIAVWRRLKKIGAAQLGDGLVALPSDARTKEHLEWVAAMVLEAGGEAVVWIATPSPSRESAALAQKMNAERDAEYGALVDEIEGLDRPVSARTLGRLRREQRRIERRDYFRAPQREAARQALGELKSRSDTADTEMSAT